MESLFIPRAPLKDENQQGFSIPPICQLHIRLPLAYSD